MKVDIWQMNLILALDNVTSGELETLAPHKNMYDLNEPRTLSKAASLPKTVVSTMSSWLNYEKAPSGDPAKRQFLEMLANT